MAPKQDQLDKMVERAEAEIQRCRDALLADPPPTPADETALMDTIDAQLAKIERLHNQEAKLMTLKKGHK